MALLVSGTIGCSSPVLNNAAGIGPTTNRRRAWRVGTDSGVARRPGGRHARSPRRPALRRHKKPASHRDAGGGSGDVAFSQRRRRLIPPLGISGQRSWLCCSFASWLDSLSSAATSVGAKPNHGFFGCQHPCAIRSCRWSSRRWQTRAPCDRFRRRPRVHLHEHHCRRMHESARNKVFCFGATGCTHVAPCTQDMQRTHRARCFATMPTTFTRLQRTRRFRHRTSPIAQNCAALAPLPTRPWTVAFVGWSGRRSARLHAWRSLHAHHACRHRRRRNRGPRRHALRPGCPACRPVRRTVSTHVVSPGDDAAGPHGATSPGAGGGRPRIHAPGACRRRASRLCAIARHAQPPRGTNDDGTASGAVEGGRWCAGGTRTAAGADLRTDQWPSSSSSSA